MYEGTQLSKCNSQYDCLRMSTSAEQLYVVTVYIRRYQLENLQWFSHLCELRKIM